MRAILFLAAALVPALLLTADDAAAQMAPMDCADLEVSLEPLSDFRSVECSSSGQSGFGGESAWTVQSKIVAYDAVSQTIIFYDHAGPQTYMERQSPRDLFEDGLDDDVKGSWEKADSSNGFAVHRFFSELEGVNVPCFAFARYGGHLSGTTGYQHRVVGIYCELITSDRPVADSRIEEMTGKIDANFF
jgi:hypothetical protein